MKLNRMAKMIVAVTMGTLSVSAQQGGAAQMSRSNAQVIKTRQLPLHFKATGVKLRPRLSFFSAVRGIQHSYGGWHGAQFAELSHRGLEER